jgi:UDP-glucose 4-epimerase
MNVLVTGAAGYIGGHVTDALVERGHNVVGIDNFSTGRKEFLNEKIQFIEGDILDTESLSRIFSKMQNEAESAVIHLAGIKYAGESFANSLKYYEINCLGTLNLLKAMDRFNIKNIVFSSSCSVYGDVPDGLPVTEERTPQPVSPYGRSKLYAEHFIKDYSQGSGIKYTNLRYFNVAGNSSLNSLDVSPFNLFPKLYKAIEGRRPFEIYGTDYETRDGSCIRDYVHVHQLAVVHVTCVEKMHSGFSLSPAYNLGSGEGISVLEIVDSVRKNIDQKLEIKISPRRLGDPAQIMANTEKAQTELNWRHYSTVDDIVLSGWNSWVSYRKAATGN